MALTNAGRDMIAGLLTGHITSPLYNAANARIGVGTGTTAYSAAQTNLTGTDFRKGMDAGFPTRVANVLTFQSTFAPGDANFAWQEWGLFNAASGGTMLNRLVEYNGTKLSGQTWIFQVELTINLG